MTWIKVAETSEVKEKSGKELNVEGNRIALFRVNGNYFAIDAICRHQDGSLAPGALDGEVVECPLHSWHYNIRTGALLDYLSGTLVRAPLWMRKLHLEWLWRIFIDPKRMFKRYVIDGFCFVLYMLSKMIQGAHK